MRVEAHVVARERGAREREAILGGRVRLAVPRPLAHEDHEPLDAEVLARRVGDRDVTECGGSNAPP